MAKTYRQVKNIYVSGSNAVQLERYIEQNDQEKVRRPKKKNVKHEKSNPIYTLVLISVIVTTLVVTVVLLKTQFIVADNAGRIIQLQQELVEIKKKNDQIESDIHKSINMDEVYKMATEELGMVQAGKDDVKYIESKDITYTVQYADVESLEEEENANIGNILAFISKGW
jgi:cell division protein FtsL